VPAQAGSQLKKNPFALTEAEKGEGKDRLIFNN
jgi:hypothetical protein